MILFVFSSTFNYSFSNEKFNVTDAYDALEQNDYEKAINIYSSLINNFDEYAPFFYGRGFAYYYLGENDNAEADFQKTIKLDSNYYDAYLGLAFVFMQKTQNAKSNTVLNNALKINPNSSDVFYSRGLLNYIEQNYNDAITDFSTAINLNKGNINAIYGRAISYYQINDYENAKIDFDKFLYESNEDTVLSNECKRLLSVIHKK